MNWIKRYEVRLVLIFLGLLLGYLAVAYFLLAPRGYYGTIEQPRFADPWIARGETILDGGLLYRDVFTSTPPLTNYLFLLPVIFSSLFGHVNPWATLGFMLYFSLFSLLGAFVLFYIAEDKKTGFESAIFYLVNPLTLGNTVLRRQDESVVVFFIGMAMLLFIQHRHNWAAAGIGVAMLIKLTGVTFLPIAFIHTFKWQYIVIPIVVFFLVLAPFLILAGEDAILWDTSKRDTEHPFQFDGVSLGRLWNRYHEGDNQISVELASIIFLAGVGLTAVYVTWKRFGIMVDYTILVGVVLLLTPKLHTGYFSFIIFSMSPLLRRYRLLPHSLLFGTVALIADFYKWPVENYPMAFWLMVVALLLLVVMLMNLRQTANAVPTR